MTTSPLTIPPQPRQSDLYIVMQPSAGAHIVDCVRAACVTSERMNAQVCFRHNGVLMVVDDPGPAAGAREAYIRMRTETYFIALRGAERTTEVPELTPFHQTGG